MSCPFAGSPMDEEKFWAIIALFDWSYEGYDQSVMQPAIAALSKLDLDSLREFDEILAAKLYALDAQQYADPTGFGSEHFSVDAFLYNRCAVVANGREFYDHVLNNPAYMPKESEFETILYLAYLAALEKGITDYEHFAALSYETFSNEAGWKNADFPDNLPPGHLPKHQR
jgi:hypothetical protein